MFKLFLKECKHLGKSLIYIAFICVAIAFYTTQYFSDVQSNFIQKPLYVQDIEKYKKENHRYPYGIVNEEIPEQVIPNATLKLYEEYSEGTYTAYPFGIIKNVTLDKEHKQRIKEILQEITGKSISDLDKSYKKDKSVFNSSKDYISFKRIMEEVNNIIGNGSSYSKENLKNFGVRGMTFEESMKPYKDLTEKDKISNGFARLFCDYMGVVMGLFPVFIVIYFFMKDRKSNMKELIYSRGVSSTKLIISRYFAVVIMIMIPILVLAGLSTIQCISLSKELNIAIDYFAFFKYSIGWLMPTVMAVTAVGMFLTLITETAIAIPIQIIWFFNSLMGGMIDGNYGNYDLSQLMIRFNTLEGRDMFVSNITNIFLNRIFFVFVSAIFVIASIYILHLKRIGRIDFYHEFSKYITNFQGKFKNSFSK